MKHDRTGCSDTNPINAEAAGSNGCARCTAVRLQLADALEAAIRNGADLSALKRLIGPTADERQAAELRLKQMDVMWERHGRVSSNVTHWPWPACDVYASLGKQQAQYESDYC